MSEAGEQHFANCLHCRCQTNSFHDIFGEIGIELELSSLIFTYFHLLVEPHPTEQQVLCDECMNLLNEFVDQEEDNDVVDEGFQEQDPNDPSVSPPDNLVSAEHIPESHPLYSDLKSPPIEESDTISIQVSEQPHGERIDENIDAYYIVDENWGKLNMQYEENEANRNEENEMDTVESPTSLMNIEEEGVNYSDEYGSFNLETYGDFVITSNLEELQFDWDSECQICSEKYTTYQDLLNHIKIYHNDGENVFHCVLENCQNCSSNGKLLARHIILAHCNLQDLQIYSNCPDCDLKFSNFTIFNKHSCYRALKRRVGMSNTCTSCGLDFPSFKRMVFHMQFHLVKRRPKVCLICETFFNDVNDFFEHVHYTHEPESTHACNRCDRIYKDRNVFEAHKKTHELNYKYECAFCPKKYDHKHLLLKHESGFHGDESNDLQCEDCGKVFRNEKHYHKHLKKHIPAADVHVYLCDNCGVIVRDREDLHDHIKDESSPCFLSTIQEEILNAAYTCEFCSLDFKSPSYLKSHRTSGQHKDKMYTCPMCKKQFQDIKTSRTHAKSHVTYEAWLSGFPLTRHFMCNVEDCEESYVQWNDLYHHKRRIHSQQVCPSCQKTFSNLADFVNHKSSCQHQIEFKCQFCSKYCPTKMSLAVHVAKTHNNKNVVCSNCNASYKNYESLQEHIEYMHVPAPCEHCHKVIKNRRNLATHKRVVHINEHRYFCSVCQKGFFHKSEKEIHERNIHTNFVHKCTECKFTTNYAKSLDIHMAMHKQDLQYSCPICDKKFGRKHVLNMHVKRHQNNRQLICSERIENGCDASFVSNHLLNKHIRKKHIKSKTLLQKCLKTDQVGENMNDDVKIAETIATTEPKPKHEVETAFDTFYVSIETTAAQCKNEIDFDDNSLEFLIQKSCENDL